MRKPLGPGDTAVGDITLRIMLELAKSVESKHWAAHVRKHASDVRIYGDGGLVAFVPQRHNQQDIARHIASCDPGITEKVIAELIWYREQAERARNK